MATGMQIVNGFLFFLGGCIAVSVMERLFHMGICH